MVQTHLGLCAPCPSSCSRGSEALARGALIWGWHTWNVGKRFVILGAGQAGGTAALELRKLGFEGSIELIGREAHAPYERPPLSKSYLAGEPYSSHDLLPHEDWYQDNNVAMRLGCTAVKIDRGNNWIMLDDGNRISYDKLLIATGSQPSALAVPGGISQQVRYLRTLEDSQNLGARLQHGTRVTIVGGGWIGLEVAAVASGSGCKVTVVDPHEVSLQPTLGSTIGGFFATVHRDHGVDFRFGRRVLRINETAGGAEVLLDDGRSLSADSVVVGIGATPETSLIDPDLLADDGGVRVDSQMRTVDPQVFAAGDIANVTNRFYGVSLRSEHWANAMMSGQIAARSMLGLDSVFDPLPFFFTDQYDLFMEYAGWVSPGSADHAVIRGDLSKRTFQAFWLEDHRVVAAMHVNRQDEGMTPLQDLIRARVRVDPARLTDPNVPLTDLLD